jgi:hypothetical protein
LVLNDIRGRNDQLLLRWQISPIFIVEIAEGPAEVEPVVDPAQDDHPAGLFYAGQLLGVIGFVVERELDCLALNVEH